MQELPNKPVLVCKILLAYLTGIPLEHNIRLWTGQTMRACLADGSIMHTALWGNNEPEVSDMMKSVLSPGANFADGGANVGLFTAIGYHFVGDRGKIISIEPTPRTFNILKNNVKHWSPFAISIHQLALSDKIGFTYINDFGPRRSGLNTLGQLPRDQPHLKGTKVLVPTTTLDHLIDSCPVNLIKLDLEEWEYLALLGAQNILNTIRPHIIFETGNDNTDQVILLLRTANYKFFAVTEGKLKLIDEGDVPRYLNVLASPNPNKS